MDAGPLRQCQTDERHRRGADIEHARRLRHGSRCRDRRRGGEPDRACCSRRDRTRRGIRQGRAGPTLGASADLALIARTVANRVGSLRSRGARSTHRGRAPYRQAAPALSRKRSAAESGRYGVHYSKRVNARVAVQPFVGKPRLRPPWLGSSHREVTTLPLVKKCTPSRPYAWVSPNNDDFQPPNE